ncbi:MAG: DUF503 domain-containing protein [Thermoleophilia bacterium]|nr:DUF503 domain-containing protein [Thermoleophilia bacterium]
MRRKRSNRSADGFIGILAADLHFPENGSLKDKRQYVRSIKAGISRKLGASVAEVGFHDLWQRARLLISLSSTTGPECERALDMALNFLEGSDCLVSGIYKEIIKVEGQE